MSFKIYKLTPFLLLIALAGCGGGTEQDPVEPPDNTIVNINTSQVTVYDGLNYQFSAEVSNSANTAVVWSVVEGQTGGSITEGGLYTAPESGGTYHVKATSKQNQNASATATVTVTKVAIAAEASSLDVGEGTSTQLAVTVSNTQNQSVRWEMTDSNLANMLSDNGEFWAPTTAGVYVVRAYSLEDERKFAEFQITVHIKSGESSYVNWKESGVVPTKLPDGAQHAIKAYGDFTGNGKLEVITSWLTYWDEKFESGEKTIEEATPATLELWSLQDDGSYTQIDNLFPADIGCIHPRKMLVADFNLDGKADVFVACHGWDKNPWPGERNRIILSENGGYVLKDASEDTGFFHGASAADLNSDGYPDVILTDNFDLIASASVLLNNQSGGFEQRYDYLPFELNGGFFTSELVDVDGDGWLDLLLGGHEWENAPTSLYLNPKTNNFTNVTPITLPSIARDQVVVDFTVTHHDGVTHIWLARTTGNAESERFYETFSVQKISWPGLESEIVFSEDPHQWFLALFPYELEGIHYVGLDDTNYQFKINF